jgi:glycosyltransferase involved in cell wall biosynthesis
LHGFESGKLAEWIQKNFDIPYLVTEHSSRFLDGTISTHQLNFAREIFKNASCRITVSNSFSEKLRALTGLNFEIVPNIVDTNFFSLGTKNKKFIFLSAGILNDNKNQWLQIESFLKIVDEYPEVELWIAGDGILKDKLAEKIELENKSESIKLLGWLSREQLRDLMRQSSCLLISSKYESFGVVAIEAMSCGLPVISTPCGGPESVILDGENGWITNGTENDYAIKMRETLKNKDVFSSEAIRSYIVNNFSNEAVAKRLCDVYSQYIKE